MSEASLDDFCAFGQTVAADFRGTLANAIVRDNVVAGAGGAAIQTLDAAWPSEIGWTFDLPGGRRAIFVRYAADRELPCALVVNGEIAQSHALAETSETIELIDWRYQCHANFAAGENSVSIRCTDQLPLIHDVAIVDIDNRDMMTIDAFWQRRAEQRAATASRRPIVVEPAAFRGVVSAIRGIANDDIAIERLQAILAALARGGQTASANGQANIPWGGPLNGQRARQQIFARMMRADPDAIIETGTYLGSSTAHLARQGLPVHTCEINQDYFGAAISNLSEFSNVRMYLQDSRAFLKGLASDPSLRYDCPFFYLDAHWYNDLPLAEELTIIRERWPRFMIMVDDFQVPGAQYGFDDYGEGRALTLDYLARNKIDLSAMAVMFPTAAAAAETSVRRGTLVLSSLDIFDAHLKYERTLFRYDTSVAARV